MSDEWVKRLWPSADGVTFAQTTVEERAAFEQLIPALLAASAKGGPAPQSLVTLAARAHFSLENWRHEGETFWVLFEPADERRGAGTYLFRTGAANADLIQAPHVYFDLGTERLGLELFLCAPEGQRPRVFAANTAHRFRPNGVATAAASSSSLEDDDGDHPADLAHNPAHLYQHVTDLLAQSMPGLRVFQLHGFAAKARKNGALSAVVSAGSRFPTRFARTVASRLVGVLGQQVRLFPDQTSELGGTRNAQARLLDRYPGARFVHLELSAQSREALRAREKLSQLAAALLSPEED